MFIQTESTPNPATLKFLPGRDVMGEGVRDFADREAANASPLAAALFQVPGVARVFFGADFISVTKTDGDWAHLKPAILGAIMEHFTQAMPLFADSADRADEGTASDEDSPIIAQIKELLDTRIRPAVAQDGGDVVFRSFEEASGTVYLHMRGSCAGCPSSRATLKHGIENMLRHYIPEITAVEQV